ncbi:MAG: hypothetical protein KAV82_13270 [Phycisphaerae bacterium]|nr:hypothetical protein [Phycisphaerae bacterium]
MLRGKQIEFFMTQEDEEVFVDFVLSKGDVWLVRHHWYEEEKYEAYNDPDEFFEQPLVVSTMHLTPRWLIWNKDLCGDNLVFDSFTVRKPPGKRFYTIRCNINYVIEFTRCTIKDGVMREGRIAYLEEYEDENGVLHRKDDSLVKWYGALARWIKKNGVRTSWDGKKLIYSLFIMPGALEFYHQGGMLGQIAGKPGAFQPLKKDLGK